MEVRSSCRGCIASFQAAISTLKDRGNDKERHLIDKTRDELERFSLWAGNIGALNAPTSPLSLESRLRDVQDILDHIVELLDDLHEAASDLQRCLERQGEADGKPPEEDAADDEDDEDEAEALVAEAGSYITRLFRITKIIRQAAPTDRFTKALSRERLKLDDHFDISHVGAKFPKLAFDDQAWLRQRLGRAITQRRQFLRYTREHRDKLESSGAPDDGLVNAPGPQPQPSRVPGVGMARSEDASRPSTFYTKATTVDVAQVSSVSLHLDQESDTEDDAKSYTTISRSVDGDLEKSLSDRVPKLSDLQFHRVLERSVFVPQIIDDLMTSTPNEPDTVKSLREHGIDPARMNKRTLHQFSTFSHDARLIEIYSFLSEVRLLAQARREIECPFCCEIKKFGNERAWRRHVYSDLRPYVCTFSDCPKPYFGDVNEWFNHEMQCHRVSYACQLCQGRVYVSDGHYLDHVKRRHPAFLVEGGEQTLLDIGKQSVQQILAEDCPCCTDWTDRLRQRLPGADTPGPIHVTPVVFKRHLASHLEQLALFALPLPTSASDAQGSNVAMDVEKEKSGRSEALSSLDFDSQPPSLVDSQPPSPIAKDDLPSPGDSQPEVQGDLPSPVDSQPEVQDDLLSPNDSQPEEQDDLPSPVDSQPEVQGDLPSPVDSQPEVQDDLLSLNDSQPEEHDELPSPVHSQPPSPVDSLLEEQAEPPPRRNRTPILVTERVTGEPLMIGKAGAGFNPPPEVTEGQRAHLYDLRKDDWSSLGVGFCRAIYEEASDSFQIAYITLESEDDVGRFLLKVAVGGEGDFQIQLDTMIVWRDMKTGKDMALSFQNRDGCATIWNFIKGVQQSLAEDKDDTEKDDKPQPSLTMAVSKTLERTRLSVISANLNADIQMSGATYDGTDSLNKLKLKFLAADESPGIPENMRLALLHPDEVLGGPVVLDEAVTMTAVQNAAHAPTLLGQLMPPSSLITSDVVTAVLQNTEHTARLLQILAAPDRKKFSVTQSMVTALRGEDHVREFAHYLSRWQQRDVLKASYVESLLQEAVFLLGSTAGKEQETAALEKVCEELGFVMRPKPWY